MLVTNNNLKNLYLPPKDSHKGKNGRLLIIGGSHLFHSASLWALKVASRIVDLVHYSSVPENNQIVQKLKEEFRDGIVVPRAEVESYVEEDDCVLIGPGMVRAERNVSRITYHVSRIEDIEKIKDEGAHTYLLTKYLLTKYPKKKWVIDAGALQMLDPDWIPENAILTPHKGEFGTLISKIKNSTLNQNKYGSGLPRTDLRSGTGAKLEEQAQLVAKEYNCIILLKGEKDIVASKDQIKIIEGGNAGMTKGGTGDVLAGLVAALYCKNEAWTSAVSASYINKKTGEDLYKKMGYWFNASDLADQIPQTMKRLILK